MKARPVVVHRPSQRKPTPLAEGVSDARAYDQPGKPDHARRHAVRSHTDGICATRVPARMRICHGLLEPTDAVGPRRKWHPAGP